MRRDRKLSKTFRDFSKENKKREVIANFKRRRTIASCCLVYGFISLIIMILRPERNLLFFGWAVVCFAFFVLAFWTYKDVVKWVLKFWQGERLPDEFMPSLITALISPAVVFERFDSYVNYLRSEGEKLRACEEERKSAERKQREEEIRQREENKKKEEEREKELLLEQKRKEESLRQEQRRKNLKARRKQLIKELDMLIKNPPEEIVNNLEEIKKEFKKVENCPNDERAVRILEYVYSLTRPTENSEKSSVMS